MALLVPRRSSNSGSRPRHRNLPETARIGQSYRQSNPYSMGGNPRTAKLFEEIHKSESVEISEASTVNGKELSQLSQSTALQAAASSTPGMSILVLGGTQFLGRHFTEQALERGHQVTLFNRGKSHPELFPEAEKLIGNRESDLSALEGRKWDAVVDMSGNDYEWVMKTVELLEDATEHYTFVSSQSVYQQPMEPGQDESAPHWFPDPRTGMHFGLHKSFAEKIVKSGMPDKNLIVRPGLLIGPHDNTDRFTYWVDRMAEGGEVLVPDALEQPVQMIDARDLATWMIDLVEQKQTGTFNANGPEDPLIFRDVIESSRAASPGVESNLRPLPEEFLREEGVVPFMDLPLWLGSGGEAMMEIDNSKAFEHGLRCRPLEETIADTKAWSEAEGDRERVLGLTRESESELLQKFQQ